MPTVPNPHDGEATPDMPEVDNAGARRGFFYSDGRPVAPHFETDDGGPEPDGPPSLTWHIISNEHPRTRAARFGAGWLVETIATYHAGPSGFPPHVTMVYVPDRDSGLNLSRVERSRRSIPRLVLGGDDDATQ